METNKEHKTEQEELAPKPLPNHLGITKSEVEEVDNLVDRVFGDQGDFEEVGDVVSYIEENQMGWRTVVQFYAMYAIGSTQTKNHIRSQLGGNSGLALLRALSQMR